MRPRPSHLIFEYTPRLSHIYTLAARPSARTSLLVIPHGCGFATSISRHRRKPKKVDMHGIPFRKDLLQMANLAYSVAEKMERKMVKDHVRGDDAGAANSSNAVIIPKARHAPEWNDAVGDNAADGKDFIETDPTKPVLKLISGKDTWTNLEHTITKCECIISYTFDNKVLCLEALQASTNPVQFGGEIHHIKYQEGSRMLAILGDSLLKTVLCKLWAMERRNPEGRLNPATWRRQKHGERYEEPHSSGVIWSTKLQNTLVTNTTFNRQARDSGLLNCVLRRPFITELKDQIEISENLVEAITGAVYEDACARAGDAAGSCAVNELMTHLGLDKHELLSTRARQLNDSSQALFPDEKTRGVPPEPNV